MEHIHLHMTLLQTSLDAVEVVGIQMKTSARSWSLMAVTNGRMNLLRINLRDNHLCFWLAVIFFSWFQAFFLIHGGGRRGEGWLDR